MAGFLGAYLGGGGGMASAPSLTVVSPVSGTELAAKTTPVTFTVDNPSEAAFNLLIKFISDSRTFVIYDSTAGFLYPFEQLSTVNDADPSSVIFSVVQNGGWQGDIESFYASGGG